MQAETSILIGNAARGLPIIISMISAALTISSLRYYLSLKKRFTLTGLLRPAAVWSVCLSFLLLDLFIITGSIDAMGEPFTWRIIWASFFLAIMIYPLALVVRMKPKPSVQPVKDNVDLISMLVDRSIEKDRNTRIAFGLITLAIVIVFSFMTTFTVVNYSRMNDSIDRGHEEIEEMLELIQTNQEE